MLLWIMVTSSMSIQIALFVKLDSDRLLCCDESTSCLGCVKFELLFERFISLGASASLHDWDCYTRVEEVQFLHIKAMHLRSIHVV
jgi:hypothetical protein